MMATGDLDTPPGVQGWLEKVTRGNTTCLKVGCQELAGRANDYCPKRQSSGCPRGFVHQLIPIDACHLCHDSPSVVQFLNEQGFCRNCKTQPLPPPPTYRRRTAKPFPGYDTEARQHNHGGYIYPVIEWLDPNLSISYVENPSSYPGDHC